MSQIRRRMVPNKEVRIPEVAKFLLQWKTDCEDEGEICPICFESFKELKVDADGKDPCSDPLELNGGNKGFIVVTPCNHKFGDLCLGSWLIQKDTCPMCRSIILPLEPAQSTYYLQRRHRSHSTESYSTSVDIQAMAPTHPITRSISLNGIAVTTPFELQRWNARFGYLNQRLDEAESLGAEEAPPENIHLPPVGPSFTTHGHPATPTSTAVEPEFTRRTYNSNITTYDLTHRLRNDQPSRLTRPSVDPSWRNWDYTSRYNVNAARRQRRVTNSRAAAVGVPAGLASVAGIPRAEITASTGGNDTISSRTGSDNDHSIVRAMGHVMGLGTVVGMPRAEWRSTARPLSPLGNSRRPRFSRNESAHDGSTETLPTTRRRETSSIEEELRRLPGLASSMWARTWG